MASFLDIIKGLTSSNKSAPKSNLTTSTPYTLNPSFAPGTGLTLQTTPGVAFSAPAPTSPTPQVQGATTSNYGTYDPQAAAAQAQQTSLQGDVRNRISSIQAAYDALTGNIDNIVNERANQYNQNYDQQLGNLTNAYQTNANQLGGAYGARGLGDSSFYGNAQTDAGNIYNQNVGNILQDKNNTLGQLGQYAQSAKTQYGAGKNAYNDVLGQLGQFDSSQLGDLYNQLGTQLGNVQTQQAGIGTNADFLGALNKITPTQNQGTSQLASKLQQLVTSGAPQFAKSQIAQGLIKQAQLTDPNAVSYWNNFYQSLLNGQA